MRSLRSLAFAVVLLAVPLLATSGCSWQAYAVSRGIRAMTGAETRLHTLKPLTSSLREYRTIELQPFDDLLPGRVPPDLERYLNAELAAELKRVPTSPAVVLVDPLQAPPGVGPDAVDTLVCRGVIDDYDPGYLALRLVELGFNHVAITARLQLSDKSNARLVAAASVTSQDDRAIATLHGAVDRLVHRFGQFVDAGYGR